MLKKQQEKEEGMDKLSKKQKSKIRSKAMVSTFYSSSCWWEIFTYYDKKKLQIVSKTVNVGFQNCCYFFYLGKIEKEGLFFIFDGLQLNELLYNLID
jgi:hypothetical protein